MGSKDRSLLVVESRPSDQVFVALNHSDSGAIRKSDVALRVSYFLEGSIADERLAFDRGRVGAFSRDAFRQLLEEGKLAVNLLGLERFFGGHHEGVQGQVFKGCLFIILGVASDCLDRREICSRDNHIGCSNSGLLEISN